MTARLYEGMFLLDNQLVREDWKRAKALVTDYLEKHGAQVLSARRWDERRLAYDIQRKRRATYLLAYYEIAHDAIPALVRDLELSEPVLRHLQLQVDAVPETERELAAAEDAADFQVPAPPPDDHVEEQAQEEDYVDDRYDRPRGRRRIEEDDAEVDEAPSDDDAEGDDDSKAEKVGARASKED
jgi:small subunit ribosomal protein S6